LRIAPVPGFAIEAAHVNIWKTRLAGWGFRSGASCATSSAVIENRPDDFRSDRRLDDNFGRA
jgi:hypothetical protein